MKKFKKILSLCFVVILALSLCSCRAIDEMRKSRAVYTDDTQTKITANGETFLLVENWNNDFDTESEEYLTVSQKDVPLLAAQVVGEDAFYASDKRIICVNYSRFYVREDVYEYAQNFKIENLTQYCYQYYEDEDDYEPEYAFVSDDIIKMIDETIKNAKVSEQYLEIESWISLNKTDKALLIKAYYGDINVDIDGKVTVSVYDDEEGKRIFYSVPKEYEKELADFVKEKATTFDTPFI